MFVLLTRSYDSGHLGTARRNARRVSISHKIAALPWLAIYITTRLGLYIIGRLWGPLIRGPLFGPLIAG